MAPTPMVSGDAAPLVLHNSLSRADELFVPIDANNVRVYSCGPTVYHDAHIGNLRAYVFTDTLVRVLRWKGWPVTHVLNITDVGHLQSDADTGEDKMEARARAEASDIWAVAARHIAEFEANLADLNIAAPTHMPRATDHVSGMIDWARAIEDHCYRLPDGLYFDTGSVPDYGRLARAGAPADNGEDAPASARIAEVAGKRQPADFAIWRTSAPDERRQMEWPSPWGAGAPGWHIECSVMAAHYLGSRFDIHTGGIDHREIHHPNEIAQNQARSGTPDTGANFWLHNNFLVMRDGDAGAGRDGGGIGSAKMSKSAGDFLTLRRLVEGGFHPLSYRLMCLQAHYRSELEFSWDNLLAAQVRLKRLVQTVAALRARADAGTGPAGVSAAPYLEQLDLAVSADLATPRALPALDAMLADKRVAPADRLAALARFDAVLGLRLGELTREALRVRPAAATITAPEIADALAERRAARVAKDFARSDAIRDTLTAAGVEVMDGDPLAWDWRPIP